MLTLSPYINIGSGHVLFLKSKNFANNIDLGGWWGGGVWGEGWWGGGVCSKIDFLFCLNSFAQYCRYIRLQVKRCQNL